MSKSISCFQFIRLLNQANGGVVKVITDLCDVLSSRGHKVTLATCDAHDVPEKWNRPESNSPQVIELGTSSFTKLRLSRSSVNIARDLIAECDMAHLHGAWDLCNFQLSDVLQQEKKPYVVSTHGMLDDWSMAQKTFKKRVFLKLGGSGLFQHTSCVHFASEGEQKQAGKWLPESVEKKVIPLMVDLTHYDILPGAEPALKAFPDIRPDLPIILFLGRIHYGKGIHHLIDAAALLKDRGFSFQVFIAGPFEDSYGPGLEDQVKNLGLGDMVHFLGMVRGKEKTSLYQVADVCVLPTHQENFGLVSAEAMACGTPVVTTRGCSIWQELRQCEATIIERTPETIADTVADVIENPKQSKRQGQKSRELIRAWLDRDRIIAGYEDFYRGVIAEAAK